MTSLPLQPRISELDPSEPLTAIHLYRRDLANACPPTADQVIADGTEARAKAGDQQARETLLLCLQDYVQYWAGRFARAYCWAPRIEYSELVSIANLAIVEHMERAATQERMFAYLAARAKFALMRYCKHHLSPITTPQDYAGHVFTAYQVLSLDKALTSEMDVTFGDTIAAPDLVLTNSGPDEEKEEKKERQLALLKQALPALPEHYSQVLTRLYGLDGQEPETPTQAACTLSSHASRPLTFRHIERLNERACRRLRALLGTTTTRDVMEKQKHRDLTKAYRARKAATDPTWQEAERARLKAYQQSLDPQERARLLQRKRERDARYRAKKRAERQAAAFPA